MSNILVENRKARHEYEILEQFQAGIMLTGAETKSLRNKHASLTGSYVKIVGGKLVLIGCQISPYPFAPPGEDLKRTRTLLVHKREIAALEGSLQRKKMALVPLAFELEGKYIKLRVALARGKQQFEKRRAEQSRQLERELRAQYKRVQV